MNSTIASMLPSMILEKAQEILLDENKWHRGSYACGKGNIYVPPNSKAAIKFCSIGVVLHVVNESHPGFNRNPMAAQAIEYLNEVSRWRGFVGIGKLNDDPQVPHSTVIHVFDEAIELAKSHEQKINAALR